MRLITGIFVLILAATMADARGGSEDDLLCRDSERLESVDYEDLQVKTEEITERSETKAVVCIFMLRADRAAFAEPVRTVVEVQFQTTANAETQKERAEEEGWVQFGSFVLIHQEIKSLVRGWRVSPYFTTQMVPLPEISGDVHDIVDHLTHEVMGYPRDSPDVTFKVRSLECSEDPQCISDGSPNSGEE